MVIHMNNLKSFMEENLSITILDIHKSLTEYENTTPEMILYLLVVISENYNIPVKTMIDCLHTVSPYEIISLCNMQQIK